MESMGTFGTLFLLVYSKSLPKFSSVGIFIISCKNRTFMPCDITTRIEWQWWYRQSNDRDHDYSRIYNKKLRFYLEEMRAKC